MGGDFHTVRRARQAPGMADAADEAEDLVRRWENRDRSDILEGIAGNQGLRGRRDALLAERAALGYPGLALGSCASRHRAGSLEREIEREDHRDAEGFARDDDLRASELRRKWAAQRVAGSLEAEAAPLRGRLASLLAEAEAAAATNRATWAAAHAAECDQAGAVTALEALSDALRAAAPDHPLLAPTDFVDPFGSPTTEFERLFWASRARGAAPGGGAGA